VSRHGSIIAAHVYDANCLLTCSDISQTSNIKITNNTLNSLWGRRRVDVSGVCAANGGGDGSTAHPWQAACIQAAINAAVDGNTVFLAAGNWELNTAAASVSTGKNISLVGTGSGNTLRLSRAPQQRQRQPGRHLYTRVHERRHQPYRRCSLTGRLHSVLELLDWRQRFAHLFRRIGSIQRDRYLSYQRGRSW
jgi:hypothetical protein